MEILKQLMRIKELDYEIDNLVERRKYYHDKATKITTAYNEVGGGNGSYDSGKIEEYVTRMADTLIEIEEKDKELECLRYDAEQQIDKVHNIEYKKLLKLKYLYYYSWKHIAKELNCSLDNVKGYMRSKAMEELEKNNTN